MQAGVQSILTVKYFAMMASLPMEVARNDIIRVIRDEKREPAYLPTDEEIELRLIPAEARIAIDDPFFSLIARFEGLLQAVCTFLRIPGLPKVKREVKMQVIDKIKKLKATAHDDIVGKAYKWPGLTPELKHDLASNAHKIYNVVETLEAFMEGLLLDE